MVRIAKKKLKNLKAEEQARRTSELDSFAQMALPISVALKGTLWVILFGLAKATQYTALLILGKEGVRRLRGLWKTKMDAE